MTEPIENKKETPKFSPKEIVIGVGFWFVVFFLIVSALSKCSSESGVSSAQQKRYDDCMLEKQKLGVGVIKADELCAYWKRANP